MPVSQAVGVLYITTALVSGYWEISLMLRPLIGGPWSWWYVVTLGASVLLLMGGIHTVAPHVRWGWLVGLAVIVSLVLWGLFRDGSWVWLAFTVVTALVAWGAFVLASTLNRGSVVAIIASVALAVWWVPASVRSLSAYLSPKPPGKQGLTELLIALLPLILILASLITAAMSKSPGTRGLAQPGASPTATTR